MSKGVQELHDLIKNVEHTPQWTVNETAKQWHICPPGNSSYLVISKASKVSAAQLRQAYRKLEAAGWTPQAAKRAVKEVATKRTASAREKAERKTAELLAATDEEPEQTALPLYEANTVGGPEHLPPGPLGVDEIYSVDNVLLSPELAEKFLDTNIEDNRPPTDERVVGIAADIKSGRWVRNGNRICFALMTVDGKQVHRLIDGQKRCLAVVKAGIAVPVDLIYNLPPEAFATIDTQQPRSAGNVLHMRGVKNANMIAAGIKMVWMYDGKRGDNWSIRVTNPHVNELYDQDPGGWQAAALYVFGLLSKTARDDRSIFAQRALLSTYYVCRRAYPKNPRLNEFFDGVISGLGIPRDTGDPRYKLRRVLKNEATIGVRKNGKRHFALVITAYNSFMVNDKKAPIVWSDRESVPDPVRGG